VIDKTEGNAKTTTRPPPQGGGAETYLALGEKGAGNPENHALPEGGSLPTLNYIFIHVCI